MTEFLISDTFTEIIARLTGEEQRAVKTTGTYGDSAGLH